MGHTSFGVRSKVTAVQTGPTDRSVYLWTGELYHRNQFMNVIQESKDSFRNSWYFVNITIPDMIIPDVVKVKTENSCYFFKFLVVPKLLIFKFMCFLYGRNWKLTGPSIHSSYTSKISNAMFEFWPQLPLSSIFNEVHNIYIGSPKCSKILNGISNFNKWGCLMSHTTKFQVI